MMDLIKPPTDNLYKFIAMAGLVLIVLGLIYAPWLFYRSTLETLKSAQADAELAVHRKSAEERQKTFDARKQQVEAERDKLQTRINELLDSKNPDRTLSSEVDKLETRLRDRKATAEALADAEHELNLSLRLKEAQAEHQRTVSVNERRNTRLIMWIGILIVVFGIVISFIGFRLWYKRLTVFQDALVVMQATSTTMGLAKGVTEGSE